MATPVTYAQFLRRNLTVSGVVILVGAVGVAGYGLMTASEINWSILSFLAVGMLASSFINAAIDSRKAKKLQ